MVRSLLSSPLALAVLVTVANIAKPVTVDDTAYLAFARHIATNPRDPYGFTIFWWARPEPAMGVLCPPVLPYWLALGINIFGEFPALLKLWMFPFLWLLAWALRSLLVRFARGVEDFALPLLMLSPAVLPTVNLMLDVPAVALAVVAVELFVRASSRGSWWLAIAAGIAAGLAMQTKYTAFVAPAVIAWYGLTHRRFLLASVTVGISVAVFTSWELWLVQKYGVSHFWLHAAAASSTPAPEGQSKLAAFVSDKLGLIPQLAGQFGCLAVGVGLLAGSMLRLPRRWLVGIAIAWCAGFVLVATLPRRWTVLDGDLTATTVFWQLSGVAWLIAIAGCAGLLLCRVKKGLSFRLHPDALFLVGWLAIEIAAALALTPFPAARRVIGVTLAAGLLAARPASRVRLARRDRPLPRWVLGLGIAAGLAVAAIDTLDAYPEKICAELSADITRERPAGATVWYVGHWGFQYYCEREGMRPLVAGGTIARTGDFVVIPVYPDGDGFYRPYAGFTVREPIWSGDEITVVEWDDWLSAQTVPNFYGGIEPISGRDHPRLRVRVYRLRADWMMR